MDPIFGFSGSRDLKGASDFKCVVGLKFF